MSSQVACSRPPRRLCLPEYLLVQKSPERVEVTRDRFSPGRVSSTPTARRNRVNALSADIERSCWVPGRGCVATLRAVTSKDTLKTAKNRLKMPQFPSFLPGGDKRPLV